MLVRNVIFSIVTRRMNYMSNQGQTNLLIRAISTQFVLFFGGYTRMREVGNNKSEARVPETERVHIGWRT